PQRLRIERAAELLDLRERAGRDRELAQARCCLHDTGWVGRPDAEEPEQKQSQVGMEPVMKHEGNGDAGRRARRVPLEQLSLDGSTLFRRENAEGKRSEEPAHLE